MRKAVILLCICFTFAACSNHSEEIRLSGEITRIEGDMISIEHSEIIVDDGDEFKVGQQVEAVLIDHSSTEAWTPQEYDVKDIQILNE
ncbi:hypothetical protein SAMN05216353_15813 [Halobacillus alkaliphilus]|uniref:DUF3221 domain-containing protein n=1 Tax=Halobacillus alkaliphilus TaxID=396056 RepID=A0A1I2T5P4_9BACI|nr:hypothetical protein [Halobacillus alkaliphilus]SFG57571.1 hypothetical protein SAMN05216353_15813 [Halobacillus alkaliphilus]